MTTNETTYTSDQLGDLYAQQRQDAEKYLQECVRADLAEFQLAAFRDALEALLHLVNLREFPAWATYLRYKEWLNRTPAQWTEMLRASQKASGGEGK